MVRQKTVFVPPRLSRWRGGRVHRIANLGDLALHIGAMH